MASAYGNSRRRRRSSIEEEEEADSIRSSQRSSPSTGSKRARSTQGSSDSEPESFSPSDRRPSFAALYEDEDKDQFDNDGRTSQSDFQPGSIIRVKLTNFVTYANAEFFPGPNLNMVIGPNGTGKSSLVCAICLGLGWGPQHLGRAGQVGEFVKHNTDVAEVEIELQKRPNEASNYVVRVRIIRDGNQREWFLQGKKTSLKAVQSLTRSLSIQVDNLCQFLPQDKVAEFSGLSPVDLLLHTQRAAAPEHMVDWHNKLKARRKEQKALEQQHELDKETLDILENRQQNLQAEVRRLEERQEIQEKLMILRKKIPYVEYKTARAQHIEYKKRKDDAKARLRRLRDRVEPLLANVHQKEADSSQISLVIREREAVLKSTEGEADKVVGKITALDQAIQETENAVESERSLETNRRKDVRKIQQTISELKFRLNDQPIEFNGPEWNERIVSTTPKLGLSCF